MDDSEYESDFINDTKEKNNYANQHLNLRLDDAVHLVYLKLTDCPLEDGDEVYIEAAEAAFSKLCSTMKTLSAQAEAGWTHDFSRLLKRSHAAHITHDKRAKRKIRTNGICAACGRDEDLCDARVDLFGSFDVSTICQPATLKEDWETFKRDHVEKIDRETDHGTFFLGTDCLKKFKISWMAKTYVVDLINSVADAIERNDTGVGYTDESTGRFVAHYIYPSIDDFSLLQEQIRRAIVNSNVDPPWGWPCSLFSGPNAVASWVEARRRRRITLKALYLTGLANVGRVGKEQGGEDDDGASSHDAENSCSEEEMVGVRTRKQGKQKAAAPKKRRIVESEDEWLAEDDEEEEVDEDEEDVPLVQRAPSEQGLQSGGDLSSRRRVLAGMHDLASDLSLNGQHRKAASITAGIMLIHELMEALEKQRAR